MQEFVYFCGRKIKRQNMTRLKTNMDTLHKVSFFNVGYAIKTQWYSGFC